MLSSRRGRCGLPAPVTMPDMAENATEEVKTAIAGMYALMDRLSKFGASDTEPRGVFADILRAQADGEDAKVPSTAAGWQLFSDMTGADDAARRLHDEAVRVVEVANRNHRGLVAALQYYF